MRSDTSGHLAAVLAAAFAASLITACEQMPQPTAPLQIPQPTAPLSPCDTLIRVPVIHEFPLPSDFSYPSGITAGPDGNVWFTEGGTGEGGSKIARITPQGVITEFPTITPASGPNGIALGPDENLWFTETYASKIGRITPAGSMTEYPLADSNSDVRYITKGPDGDLWFTETVGQKVGRITTSGTITEFSVASFGIGSGPQGITTGPDGNLWFLEDTAPSDAVVRMTPVGKMTVFPIPKGTNVLPNNITVGPNGNLWFSGFGVTGQITPLGTFEPPRPTWVGSTWGIAAGPYDDYVWFTTWAGNQILALDPSGGGAFIPVPTPRAYPNAITAGPDGNMWFTETFGNKIGCVRSRGL